MEKVDELQRDVTINLPVERELEVLLTKKSQLSASTDLLSLGNGSIHQVCHQSFYSNH